jgi:hypothetical protein
MRQSYTAFKFNGQVFHEDVTNYRILNATLSNDFYADKIRGSRSIVEEKIPGRDIPYYYEVEDSPLEFEVTFAFAESMTKAQIKNIIRTLLKNRSYKELTFGNYSDTIYTAETPTYKVIFDGDSSINYISRGYNAQQDEIFIAYITLKARVDRPYGFDLIEGSLSAPGSQITINNTGDLESEVSLQFKNVTQNIENFRIFNETNSSSITFTELKSGEVVTINGNLKIMFSSVPNSNIYSRWQRDDIYLNIGSNVIKFQKYNGSAWVSQNLAEFSITSETPVYIK